MKEIYLAGGCFWGMEKAFQALYGVKDTSVGYANGNTENPTYEEVCKDYTGYKETVAIQYEEKEVSLEIILKAYFLCIDPTVKNRQGNDIGTQYQTGIYYVDEESKEIIEKYVEEERKKYTSFYVEVEALKNYVLAEDYHQDYLIKNPTGYCHITTHEIEEIQKLNPEK